jgi:hypothetical protein
LENKDQVVKKFNEDWAGSKDTLFSASGGKGQLLGFEVDDAFFYKGNIVISTLFLWKEGNGAAKLGRGAVLLDPDKDLEISGCQMLGTVNVTQEDLKAAFASSSSSATQAIPERVQVHAKAPTEDKPFFDESTKQTIKNTLIAGGITLTLDWLRTVIISSGK